MGEERLCCYALERREADDGPAGASQNDSPFSVRNTESQSRSLTNKQMGKKITALSERLSFADINATVTGHEYGIIERTINLMFPIRLRFEN
jgi:hypothetical protein